ncbi:MAG: 2-iminoacetate synthase ThiH [Methanomassiliicoccaceae archaeon]|nr:2-iminoacetate synthase ThiH [Methanomassiliicoccaceae archaeon]
MDRMDYLDNMETTSPHIMEKVLDLTGLYDPKKYDREDVITAVRKDRPNVDDYGALLSEAAEEHLEMMAVRARKETREHFGNSVSIFTPLYISNYCENHCTYCGFNVKNKIERGKLSLEDAEKEMRAISGTGLEEILILTGESRSASSVGYIGDVVRLAKRYFSTIGIEIYPLNTDEYRYMNECGADFVSVYQETYDPDQYERYHLSGPKRSYPYRFNSHERALKGGMRGVGFGSLLGLGDFRKDAFSTGIHAYMIQQKYPHAEISFSVPRIRSYMNMDFDIAHNVRERQLMQVLLAYRIFMPFASITISSRERAGFRDNIIGLAANRISAGVKVGVGGHGSDKKGDEQFDVSDPRDVAEVHAMIKERGLQPVYTDYIRMI